jgi:hypothetical protein
MAIVKINNVRVAFLNVFEAEAFAGDDATKRFQSTLIIPPDHPSIASIKSAIIEVATEKWKDKVRTIVPLLRDKQKLCYSESEYRNKEGLAYSGFEGMFWLRASRREDQGRPLVLDANKSPLTERDGRPYSGCYCNVHVDIWAQDNKWGQRVNATLVGVQFVRDGDAFTGGAKARADDFDDVSTGADAGDEGSSGGGLL